ncbi:MAG TPA: zf-HC2 domain-containing protein [Actinomycetota bacterium]|nr:zf-HC2 domain-containing protein [Actinomycetota bacterium]
MACPAVRDLLAERVLGTLEEDRRRFVDRHLEWCAGCRKEMAELAEGAATVVSALAPAEPPDGLEDRVVGAIRAAAGQRLRGRTPRVALVAAAVAGLVAVGALGWAVAMTGRVTQLEKVAGAAASRAERFENVLREILIEADDGRILSAELLGVGDAVGGGRGILFDSPGGRDWALVIAGGLPSENGPYLAYLTTGGKRQRLGRLSPSSPGELAVYRIFSTDVSGAHWVSVRDRTGETVLRGGVTARRG